VDIDLAGFGGEAQRAVVAPADPAVVGMQAHALFLQSAHPAAQQRRSLAVDREHAAGAADIGLHAKAGGPVAQRLRVEAVQPAAHGRGLLAVAAVEQRPRIGMGEVEPALAGDQELAAGRALGLVQVHVQPGGAQALGGEQAGRATADDGDPMGQCGITA
jgi:hypothetical protein